MHTRILGRFAAATALLISVGPAKAASADAPPTGAQLNAARALFIAAEKNEDAERWGDALDKLVRVSAVKLTSGVRYHTALCEEHLGRLVAALRDYKAAANQAHSENAADVLRLVDKRVADAGDKLPKVTIVLVPSLPDATVWLDGEPVPSGAPVDLDPGSHKIEARAAGRVPFEASVTVVEHDSTSIEVKLDPIAQPAPASPPPPPPAPSPKGESAAAPPAAPRHRALALVGTAATLALVAGGIGAYAVASTEHSDAVAGCAQVVSLRTDECDSKRNLVRAWDWVAVGAWAGALATATLATVSFVRLRRDADTSAQLVVGPGSVALRGSF
jgi:hypothetical protein